MTGRAGRAGLVALALVLAAWAVAARAGETLPWSEAPGAFEAQLQRRQGNPLFPPDERRITAGQVLAAQERDRADAEALRQSFDKLVEALARWTAGPPPAEAIGLLEAVFELRRRAAGIGGPASAIAGSLLAIRRALVDGLEAGLVGEPARLRDLRRLLERREMLARIVTEPFVARMQRLDGPIGPGDATATLLSEPPGTIRLFASILRQETKRKFREDAARLVERVHFEGNEVALLEAKLAALK